MYKIRLSLVRNFSYNCIKQSSVDSRKTDAENLLNKKMVILTLFLAELFCFWKRIMKGFVKGFLRFSWSAILKTSNRQNIEKYAVLENMENVKNIPVLRN